MSRLHSRMGTGWVRHRRHSPRAHAFRYRLCMPLLDLDEAPEVVESNRWWGWNRRAPVSVRREDYLEPADRPLRDAVLDAYEQQRGERPCGRVEMLANPRYFGYCFNPIALYFLHDEDDTLVGVLAEVRNTPWGENTAYAMPVPRGERSWKHRNAKAMHVSPFLPMDMEYRWKCSRDERALTVHIENHRNGERVFDATLHLNLAPMSRNNMTAALLRYPLMTFKVIAAIHWQALRLWLKRVPIIAHPGSSLNT